MEHAPATRVLIIDGHNVLFALRVRFAEQLVDGHPGTAAREALVETLLGACTGPGRVVHVYFDGDTPHTEQRSAQLEVIYPGGEGDQRADKAILARLSTLASEVGSSTVTVVTRDRKLSRRARRRGATVVDPAAFFEAWVEKPG